MNSRAKGCRGEREWRDVLRAAGFMKSRRGQQFAGGQESPDVICEDLPGIHFEVKRVEAGNLYKWMTQAIRDAFGGGIVPTKMPVVAHKKNNCEWLIVIRAEDFLNLLKETNQVAA